MSPLHTFDIDLSRRLTPKERRAFVARRNRLEGAFGESARNAQRCLQSRAAPERPVVIRSQFSCLQTQLTADDVSDRSAPSKTERPPATRIMSSQGVALRFYLLLLACSQARTKTGKQPHLDLRLVGDAQQTGWADLIATGAVRSGSGRTHMTQRDKKARSLRSALRSLRTAKLVDFDPGKYEDFMMLAESCAARIGDPVPYTAPRAAEDTFSVPAGFFANGWINVLEDSEIAVILMLACGKLRLPADDQFDVEPGEIAIPASDRVLSYGISRDVFSTARKTLEWFGLIAVREIHRHEDGRGVDNSHSLHRVIVLPDGFDQDALGVVRPVIENQLGRQA
ncbi:hypothetical protein [Allobranchiibius sp. GilTou73]|uniref:hypothetical protein n=1 Tax=Allobranchiibius sp. GilTou73 TaxID=2904523 RepID=UPI001F33D3DE|nr:hypothetical protein [Allobranchiibius sp. GilTou73]UIJ35121.1 hypothetical protein LVQ62_01545 [Allobranchiibius sp. GilTou73]